MFFSAYDSVHKKGQRQRKLGQSEVNLVFKAQKGHSHQEVKFKETEYQAKLQSRLLTYRFGAYGLLSLVMTLPWLMAFIIVFSSNEDEKYQQLWYPFVIFQGLQVNAVLPDCQN